MIMANRKSFDMSRDSIYVADPITELCIVGGKGVLPADEAGDLDTEWEAGMPLNDLKRLKKPLEQPFKANIAHRGVNTPVIIAKIGDVATVIAGKSRIRAARAANRERKKRGEPLLKVKCVMQRDVSVVALVATMVSENNARRDDDLRGKIRRRRPHPRLANGSLRRQQSSGRRIRPARQVP